MRTTMPFCRPCGPSMGNDAATMSILAKDMRDVTPEEVQQLAEEGVVQSVKWSTAEVSRVRDTKLLCGPAFPVFVGNDLIAFEGLGGGADGCGRCLPMVCPSKAVRR